MTAILVIMICWTVLLLVAFFIKEAHGDDDFIMGFLLVPTGLAYVAVWVVLTGHYIKQYADPAFDKAQIDQQIEQTRIKAKADAYDKYIKDHSNVE